MSPAAREYFTCRGERLTEISFPLGGIGSGCIGLAGNGRLTDWEIFGRPNKGGNNGFSHFAVKAERNGQVSDARVLHGATLGSLMGSRKLVRFDHYGHGPSRYTMGGFPHFSQVTFEGTFLTATLTFADPEFPGGVALRAFNPFILPLNARGSSIPAAFFEVSRRIYTFSQIRGPNPGIAT